MKRDRSGQALYRFNVFKSCKKGGPKAAFSIPAYGGPFVQAESPSNSKTMRLRICFDTFI
jgi:hypothetical protein